ncbi:interferon-induced protein with tetratricopeptide repeats 2-like [Gracilinanus agilis]|uniref:interferon-induced protein with tetratricopeptide repeats 2-like n=1 Tax=Gracilinanus agilis TaxID=191870 RepID=UPI001CFD7B22|nr:interferon-induced protein with tetratricopeptide repeats 2-like [Gracilinanus agilis]
MDVLGKQTGEGGGLEARAAWGGVSVLSLRVLTSLYFYPCSEETREALEAALRQLRCTFTWGLFKEEKDMESLEEKVINDVGFLCLQSKASGYNLLAYLKHLKGQDQDALSCLQQAEELTQQEHPGQADIRNLVTWGNYAWLYYRMGQLEEARAYLDKVAETCTKFGSPYRMDCPEIDCEEGWARLKCGKLYAGHSKACFQRALEDEPDNVELRVGLAIAAYCEYVVGKFQKSPLSELLRQTIELDPDNHYLKALQALNLQRRNDKARGEKMMEEVLEKAQGPELFQTAGQFYRHQNNLEKALALFKKALELQPASATLCHQIGCCYRNLASKLLYKEEVGELREPALREKVTELREQALEYLQKAVDLKGCYWNMHTDLAAMHAMLGHYEEAEAIFRKVFCSERLTDKERQQLYQRYGNFQEYFLGQEDSAIHHYIEGLKIQEDTVELQKMKSRLQIVAKKRLSQNPSSPQGWRLLGFLAKLNGDEALAMEYYEKALGGWLQCSVTGVGSLFPIPSPSEAKATCEDRAERPGGHPFPWSSHGAAPVLNGENNSE